MSPLYSQAQELARLAFERVGLLEDVGRERPKPAPALSQCLGVVRVDVQVELAEATALHERALRAPAQAPQLTWHMQTVLNRLARNVDLLDALLCTLTPGRTAGGTPLVERFPAPDEGALARRTPRCPSHRILVHSREPEGRPL